MTVTKLSPKLRELVVVDSLRPPAPGRLTTAQADVLAAAVTRRAEFTESVNTHRALRALAAGARPDVAVPVLAEVLADGGAPAGDRVVAARQLGLIATAAAETALRRQVRERDPQVQRAVLVALGECAEPAALDDLRRLTEPGSPVVARQLALTRALIAHRHGLDGPFLPEVPGVRRQPTRAEQRVEVAFRAKAPKATMAERERLQGSTYGVDIADRSFSLRVGRSDSTIFLNADIGTTAASLARVFERPWIAAILARTYVDRAGPTPRYLVLTRPADGGARVDLVRTDGEIVYTGMLVPEDKTIAFDVSDTGRPGSTRVHLAGRFTARGIEVEVADSHAKRIPAHRTAAVSVNGG